MTITEGYVPSFTLGDGIRKALDVAGFTNLQVAEALDVTPATVSRWINDRNRPSRADLMAVVQLTGVSLEWLLQLDSNQQPFDMLGGLLFDVVAEAEQLLLEAVQA